MKASGHNIFLRLILLLIALTAGLVLSVAVYAENSDGRIATNKINAVNYAYAQEADVTSKEGDVTVSEENFPDSGFQDWILTLPIMGRSGRRRRTYPRGNQRNNFRLYSAFRRVKNKKFGGNQLFYRNYPTYSAQS